MYQTAIQRVQPMMSEGVDVSSALMTALTRFAAESATEGFTPSILHLANSSGLPPIVDTCCVHRCLLKVSCTIALSDVEHLGSSTLMKLPHEPAHRATVIHGSVPPARPATGFEPGNSPPVKAQAPFTTLHPCLCSKTFAFIAISSPRHPSW